MVKQAALVRIAAILSPHASVATGADCGSGRGREAMATAPGTLQTRTRSWI